MSATTESAQQSRAPYVPEIIGNIRLEHLHRYLLARELAQDKTVLNIPCRDGEGAHLLASVARLVIAVDSAPDVIERASRRYVRPNLKFRGGSSAAIPAMDGSIDLVVSFEAFERQTQHLRMMDEMHRVLAPEGIVVLSMRGAEALTTSNAGQLHREEIERELRVRFSHVTILSQRTRAGSVVSPLDAHGDARFFTFHDDGDHEGGAGRLAGPDVSSHLLVFASDAPIPPVPAGFMDGGEFVWVDRSSAPLVGPHCDETTDAFAQRVADLAQQLAHKRQRLADLRELTARLHTAIDQHRDNSLAAWDQVRARDARLVDLEARHRAALEDERHSHERALAEVERAGAERLAHAEQHAAEQLARAEKEATTRAQELVAVIAHTLEAERVSRHTEVAAERERANQRETKLLAQIDRVSALLATRDQALAVMERSRSWRLTRPLRDLRRSASRFIAYALRVT